MKILKNWLIVIVQADRLKSAEQAQAGAPGKICSSTSLEVFIVAGDQEYSVKAFN